MPIFFSPSSSFGGIKGDPNIHHRGNPLYRQPNMPGFIQRRSATGMSPSERYARNVRAEERRKKREARWERADKAAAAKREERKAARAKLRFERKERAMPTRGDVEDMGSPRIPSSTAMDGPMMGMLPDNMIRTSQGGSAKTEYTKPSMSLSESVLSASKGLLDLGPARTRTATPSDAFGYPTGQAPSFRYSPNQANAQRFYIDQPPPAMFQPLPEDRYTQPIYNYLGDLVNARGF